MTTPRRVLVIEDNLDAAESLRLWLELAGHHVAVAHSGEEGLSRATEVTPEIVLCDLGLPAGMSGLDVARELRARHADTIALVALTGHSGADILREVKEAGFDMHVVKPIDPAIISKLVEQV
ncbi:MAG: response regulator [Myxococcota bacterium]|nr:response regulator [Myxococcota bacterium]